MINAAKLKVGSRGEGMQCLKRKLNRFLISY